MRFSGQLSCFFSQKVPGSNFSSDPAFLDLRFTSLSSLSKQTARQYLKLGHDQIHPFPYKFIVYQRSHLSTSEPLAASLGKRWKEKFTLEQNKEDQRGKWFSRTVSLPSAIDERWWLTPRLSLLILSKGSRYPLSWRLTGPQGRSKRVRKISPPPGFVFRTVQPITPLISYIKFQIFLQCFVFWCVCVFWCVQGYRKRWTGFETAIT